MSKTILSERLLTSAEVCSLPIFSRHGRKPHASSICRWWRRGVRARRSGELVRLRAVITPSGPKFREADVAMFVAELNGEALPEGVDPSQTAATLERAGLAESAR